jgi:heme-degrading monooxygenase HmoA
MHARSGAFRLSTDRLDDSIKAFEQEQLPKYKQADGYKGFTLMVNRETGQMIGVSFWESEAHLKASDEMGQQARAQIQEQGGGQGDIERIDWEVVVDDTA